MTSSAVLEPLGINNYRPAITRMLSVVVRMVSLLKLVFRLEAISQVLVLDLKVHNNRTLVISSRVLLLGHQLVNLLRDLIHRQRNNQQLAILRALDIHQLRDRSSLLIRQLKDRRIHLKRKLLVILRRNSLSSLDTHLLNDPSSLDILQLSDPSSQDIPQLNSHNNLVIHQHSNQAAMANNQVEVVRNNHHHPVEIAKEKDSSLIQAIVVNSYVA